MFYIEILVDHMTIFFQVIAFFFLFGMLHSFVCYPSSEAMLIFSV